MHRDKKLGLALGILLVGLVAAFFFRNEPDPFADLPLLDDPEALDAQIAEKPIAPYTDDPNEPAASQPADGQAWELPEIYRRENKNENLPEGQLPTMAGAPAPIDLAAPEAPPAGTTAPIEVGTPFDPPGGTSPRPRGDAHLPGNSAWTSVDEAAPLAAVLPVKPAVVPSAKPPATPPPNVAGLQPPESSETKSAIYQVKSGDTLSDLATKHLGSSRRYLEIYEANRDKLKNPNDLKVGMTIRIPPRVKFSDVPPANPNPSNDQTAVPPATSASPPVEAAPKDNKLFVPIARSPLSPTTRN